MRIPAESLLTPVASGTQLLPTRRQSNVGERSERRAGGILRRRLGTVPDLFSLSAGTRNAKNAIFYPCLLPSKLLQFLLRADELHRAVVEQDQATPGIVIVEREQFGPTVLIPARLGFEEKDHVFG